MMNDRTTELINREIDGLNSEAESLELNSILSSDPSAKKYFDSQKQISEALSRLPVSEPPATIKQNVMNEINSRATQRTQVFGNVFSESSWFHWGGTVRIAMGMAAGILIMAIFWPSSGNLPLNEQDMSGTIVTQGDKTNSSSTSLSQSGVRVSITWFTRDSDVIFVLSTDSSEPATIRLASSSGGNIVRTVTRDRAGNCQVVFENQSVVISHSGKNAYTVVIERGEQHDAEIDFELEVNGKIEKTTVNVIW